MKENLEKIMKEFEDRFPESDNEFWGAMERHVKEWVKTKLEEAYQKGYKQAEDDYIV